MNKLAFKMGFIKESANIDEPMPVDFVEKIVKLPKKQRKKAVMKRLKQWNQKVFNKIQSNIQQAAVNIKNEKIEEMKKKKEKQKEKKKKMMSGG